MGAEVKSASHFQYSTCYAAITRIGARPNRVVDTLMTLLIRKLSIAD